VNRFPSRRREDRAYGIRSGHPMPGLEATWWRSIRNIAMKRTSRSSQHAIPDLDEIADVRNMCSIAPDRRRKPRRQLLFHEGTKGNALTVTRNKNRNRRSIDQSDRKNCIFTLGPRRDRGIHHQSATGHAEFRRQIKQEEIKPSGLCLRPRRKMIIFLRYCRILHIPSITGPLEALRAVMCGTKEKQMRTY